MSPGRTSTPVSVDLRIAARTAHAWIDTLHNRARRAAERQRTRSQR